jgi:hypothetical protein
MSEPKDTQCRCGGYCVSVTPNDEGVTIQVRAADAEKAKAIKAVVKGCCEKSSDCCE